MSQDEGSPDSALQVLLPSFPVDGIDPSETAPLRPPQRKRAPLTSVACQDCRKRKTKCDGQKPVCCNCAKRGRHECVYDLEPNQSRVAGYKQKIDQQKSTIDALEHEIRKLKELSQQPAGFDNPLPSPYRSAPNTGGVSIQFLMNPVPEMNGRSSADHDPRRQEAIAFDRAESLKRPRSDREAELLSQQRDQELEIRTLKELILLLSSIEDRELARQMAEEIVHHGVSDSLLVRAQHLLATQMMHPLDTRTPGYSRQKRPASTILPDRVQSTPFRGQIDPSL